MTGELFLEHQSTVANTCPASGMWTVHLTWGSQQRQEGALHLAQ